MDYIDINQLSEKLAGRSISSIKRDVASDQLPKPYRISGTNLWKASEVDHHIATQSNKPQTTQRVQNMSLRALETAKTEHNIVAERYKKLKGEIAGLHHKITYSKSINDKEVAARTDAAVNGNDYVEQALIDPEVLGMELEAKQQVLKALSVTLENARLLITGVNDGIAHNRKLNARKVLIHKFGLIPDRNKFKTDDLLMLTGQELLDIVTLGKIAINPAFSLVELFDTKAQPVSDAVRSASRKRVDQMLA